MMNFKAFQDLIDKKRIIKEARERKKRRQAETPAKTNAISRMPAAESIPAPVPLAPVSDRAEITDPAPKAASPIDVPAIPDAETSERPKKKKRGRKKATEEGSENAGE